MKFIITADSKSYPLSIIRLPSCTTWRFGADGLRFAGNLGVTFVGPHGSLIRRLRYPEHAAVPADRGVHSLLAVTFCKCDKAAAERDKSKQSF